MLTKDETKKLAAVQALQYISQNMTIGIGTGSTVYWFIEALAEKVRQGLVCRGVPTSGATDKLGRQLGIPMLSLNEVDRIAVTIDGADEVDAQLNLIKGGGAALLQEKMVAAASDKLIIIADDTKFVQQLGGFPLPVEVVPYGWKQVQRHIMEKDQVVAALRMKDNQPLLTDHGHYILDCHYGQIPQPAELAISLNCIPGVVDNGLFIHMAKTAIIAAPDGTVQTHSV